MCLGRPGPHSRAAVLSRAEPCKAVLSCNPSIPHLWQGIVPQTRGSAWVQAGCQLPHACVAEELPQHGAAGVGRAAHQPHVAWRTHITAVKITCSA